jgi:hypothetical protein
MCATLTELLWVLTLPTISSMRFPPGAGIAVACFTCL